MSETAHIPQLRFPEFSGEWQRVRADKVADIIDPHPSHRAPAIDFQGIPFIGIGDILENGELDYKSVRLVSKDVYREHKKRYQIQIGDFAFGRVASVGKVIDLSNNIDKEYTYSPTMAIVRPHAVNSVFLQKYSNSEYFMKLVRNKTTGSTRKSIGMQSLRTLNIALPSKQEQQKIAAFLTSVDNKIEQLSKKKELLGDYKKGLMQKIFSQEVRFKADDGCDFPDWEEKRLDDVSCCLDSKRKPLNEAERKQMKGDIPYYGANGVVDYVNDYIFDEELVLLAEDGGNFDEFSSKPIAQKILGKVWVNNHAHILKAKNTISTNFLFYSLVHKDIRKYIVGGSRAKLNKSDLLSIKITLPSLDEQNKIANFLTSTDNKIEQVGEQLDKSKEFKKALLQQMFV